MHTLRRVRNIIPLIVLVMAVAVSALQLGAKAKTKMGCNLTPCRWDSQCPDYEPPTCWNCIWGACQSIE